MDQGVKMSPRAFVILPTRDLEGSRKFFSHLGFEFDPNFSGEQSACVIFSDGASAMLMPEEMVKSFTSKQLGDATTTAQAIVALAIDSREEVDRLISAATEAGGSQHGETQDYGPMYVRTFEDPDGHLWQAFHQSANAG